MWVGVFPAEGAQRAHLWMKSAVAQGEAHTCLHVCLCVCGSSVSWRSGPDRKMQTGRLAVHKNPSALKSWMYLTFDLLPSPLAVTHTNTHTHILYDLFRPCCGRQINPMTEKMFFSKNKSVNLEE